MPITILVVDDERQMLQFVRRALERAGYRVLCASNGREALEILKTTPIDLVLSDVRMPGMSGPELLTEIGRLSPTTRTLLMSGYVGKVDLPDNVPCLRKPFSLGDMIAAIQQALEPQTAPHPKSPHRAESWAEVRSSHRNAG